MEKQKLSKFIIKAAIKDLQEKKNYSSLEELGKDVEEELVSEGFTLKDEDKEKIKEIVEEDGYTGRFSIDDIILKRLKNKKYWPIASLIAAVLIFLLTTVVGAFIEYFVQKPLDSSPAEPVTGSVIAAFFQLPSSVEGEVLDFKVTLQNQLSDKALKDLVLFASVEDDVSQITIKKLDPNESVTKEGNLNVKDINKENFYFNAYIIGNKVSFKADPIEIRKNSKGQVAFVNQDPSVGDRLEADTGTENPPSVSSVTPEASISGGQTRDTSDEVPAEYNTQFSGIESDSLAEEIIGKIKGLSSDAPERKSNIQLLEILAGNGSEKAKIFLEDVK